MRLEASAGPPGLRAQAVIEDSRRVLYFVSPKIAGFGFATPPSKTSLARPSNKLDGQEHTLAGVTSEVAALGPVLATCLNPAGDQGQILRLWETVGQSGPLTLQLHGFAALRLLP